MRLCPECGEPPHYHSFCTQCAKLFRATPAVAASPIVISRSRLMAAPRKDLRALEIGARYGHFRVVAYVGHKNRKAIWLFRCDCGSFGQRDASSVVNGYVKRCRACLHAELRQNRPIHTERDAVIVAAWVNGARVPAIAADMGLTPSTVHSALVRARRRGVAA